MLKHIEEKVGKRVADIFDLIVGTSTGGILAAGLTVPKRDGTPKFSAEDMASHSDADRGREIFADRSFWRGTTSAAWRPRRSSTSHKPLEKILKARYLGDVYSKGLAWSCNSPSASYDIEKRQPYFFKTRRAR